MTLKETLKQIRILLSMESVEVKLEQAKLVDGITVVEADSFAVDSPIFIITENGDSIPMPIGTYELEDGAILEVMVEGIIGAYTPVDAPVDEPADEPVDAAEDTPSEDAPVEDAPAVETVSKEEFDSKIAELEAMIEELKSQLGLSNQTISDKEVELEALKLELAKQPAVRKISDTPSEVTKITNNKGATKFASILNNINN